MFLSPSPFPSFSSVFFLFCCELFPPSSRPTVLVCNSIKLSAIAQISCPAFPFARLYYNSPYSASLAFNHFSSAAGRIDRTKIQQQQHYRRSSSPNMQMYIANARQESELFFFLGIYLFIYFLRGRLQIWNFWLFRSAALRHWRPGDHPSRMTVQYSTRLDWIMAL